MLKLERCLRDDVAAIVKPAVHQSSLSSVKLPRSSGDNAASDWQTPLNGIISPSERG